MAHIQLPEGMPGIVCKAYRRYVDTVEVWGSSRHGPTIYFREFFRNPTETSPVISSPVKWLDRV